MSEDSDSVAYIWRVFKDLDIGADISFNVARRPGAIGVLNDNNHVEIFGFIGIANLVDCVFSAATCSFDDEGGICGEIEMAGRVDSGVGLAASYDDKASRGRHAQLVSLQVRLVILKLCEQCL